MDDTEASLIIDDFTKEKTIQLTKVAGDSHYLFVDTFELDDRDRFIDNLKKVGFQFAFQNDKFYLRLNGYVSQNDTIQFLFEDNTVIEKTINNKQTFLRSEYAEAVELSNVEIKVFATNFLRKWKLTKYGINTFIIGGFIDNPYFCQYTNNIDGQYLLLATARQLIKQVIFHLPKSELKSMID
jgi:hypothetical protein